MAQQHQTMACQCGQVGIDVVGAPILSAACYCESCRTAGRQFEQAPGAPAVLNDEGGSDYCLYRKDRMAVTRGGEHLAERRLTPDSATRRVVATCCNTPMFLDFTKGHWLTVYRDRLPGDAPPAAIRIMTRDLPAGTVLPEGRPSYPAFPPLFLVKLLSAWVAMGFRRPKTTW